MTFLDAKFGENSQASELELQMEQNPPPFPSPEELKAKITEFMKSNFGDRVSVATFTQPEPAEVPTDDKPVETDSEEF